MPYKNKIKEHLCEVPTLKKNLFLSKLNVVLLLTLRLSLSSTFENILEEHNLILLTLTLNLALVYSLLIKFHGPIFE